MTEAGSLSSRSDFSKTHHWRWENNQKCDIHNARLDTNTNWKWSRFLSPLALLPCVNRQSEMKPGT
jgi:hypothetical protein